MADNPIAPVTKGGGKLVASLKGHKPVVYAVVGTGAIGLVIYLRHKSSVAAQQAAVPTAQDPTGGFVDPNAVDPGGSSFTSDGGFASTPAATQGAFFGNNQPIDTQGLIDALTAAVTPVDTPSTQITAPSSGLVATTASDFGAILGQQFADGTTAAPPAPAVSVVTGGGLPVAAVAAHDPAPAPPLAPPPIAPVLGPNVFFNSARGLRYIIQAQVSPSTHQTCNYRRYESALNRGDWGQGGVILIAGSCR